MGLNITIRARKNNTTKDLENMTLSKTFCNLICRKDVIEGKPELDQIGEITNCDISIFYKMENAPELDDLKNEETFPDIDLLELVINCMLIKLDKIPDLNQFLNDNDYDTLDNEVYFSNYNTLKTYKGDTFRKDLNDIKSFITLAKQNGCTLVYFSYS
jgi:hypothetical protein